MRSLIIGIVIVALIAVGVFVFVNSSSDESGSESQTSSQGAKDTSGNSSSKAPSEVTITYTSSGFSPSSVRLKKGGKLTWVNESSNQVEIGVNPHPVHTGDRSITSEEFTLNLDSGETKTITVNKAGDFGYHNHLDSLMSGNILVE
ncbi:MAG TPA: cupredoxin domain-containing protein [Candidatus Nanoarchaeia archaeon]|nr:hypothetical protein [uncultured archaeon]